MPDAGITIPRLAIPQLITMLRGVDQVQVRLDKHQAQFTVGDGELTARLVDGEFPEYTRVIPKSSAARARVAVSDLAGAVDRVSVVGLDRNHGIRIGLAEGKFTLSSNHPDVGEAVESIAVRYHGEEAAIGFNSGYLQDVLEVAKGNEAVEVSISDGLSQAAFRIVGDSHFLAIVMPMRV